MYASRVESNLSYFHVNVGGQKTFIQTVAPARKETFDKENYSASNLLTIAKKLRS